MVCAKIICDADEIKMLCRTLIQEAFASEIFHSIYGDESEIRLLCEAEDLALGRKTYLLVGRRNETYFLEPFLTNEECSYLMDVSIRMFVDHEFQKGIDKMKISIPSKVHFLKIICEKIGFLPIEECSESVKLSINQVNFYHDICEN